MCGIVGWWQKDGSGVDKNLLVRMRDKLINRGPDDAGVWINGSIGLGHRRLSILDLSPLGHQPMMDNDSGLVITYNGEVFNFKDIRKELEQKGISFKSETDTEVILSAYKTWGPDCLKKFVGMFAFAIWNSKDQSLFLARDRIGIKPLFYQITDRSVLFSSRLSPLAIHPECPKEQDPEALGLYLEIGFVPSPWSIFKGIKKLKPGHFLLIRQREVKEECYWNIDQIPVDFSLKKTSEQELVQRLDSLLRDSVKLRMISDVPLGAFLSGGVDSSLIVALMSQVSTTPPKTFTIGFNEPEYDESPYAAEIANHLGTEHHQRIMKSQDLIHLLEDNTRNYDEPFADWSSLPCMMVSKFAREKVTVCLSGDGGDELFAGYHYYHILSKLNPFYQSPEFLRKTMGWMISSIKNHRFALLGKSLMQKDIIEAFAFMRTMLKDYGRNTLFTENTLTIKGLFSQRAKNFSLSDPISKACRLDCCYYLPDDILQKMDIASMAFGLEARVPLLDHRIIEFSQALPLDLKLRYGSTKFLLKKVLAQYVPPHFFERPKKGFCVPIREWFRGELKDLLLQELSSENIKAFGFLNDKGVKRLIDLHLSKRRDTHPILWVLLSLLRWNNHIRNLKD